MTTRTLALMGLLMATPLSAQNPAVQSVPYTWQSVIIKANGFINGLVFSPTQKNLAYIHTDMGGSYRWDEADGRWVCLTDWIEYHDWSLSQMGMETLAIDPTDANRVYVGAGTYMGPSAVLRSSDQGRTWQRTNVPFTMDGNGSARNAGERMMVDPHFPQRLLYGTRDKGLWQSEDRGETWNPVESFPATGEKEGPARNAGITWVLFDRASGQPGTPTPIIYAGVMTRAEQKLFRSTDAGVTWTALPGQPGENLLPTRAVLTPDGKTLYLTYVVGDNYPGPHGVIGGAVYKVDDPASDAPRFIDISPSRGRFGWSGIAMDPQDPRTLLVSVLNRYNPTDDIYRTRDGGQTWQGLNVNANRDDSSAPYARHMGTHWVGDVQINPLDRNHAWYTTGYGMYETRELNQDEPRWIFQNEGFEQSAVLELVSPPSGDANLLSAIGDRDGYRHQDLSVSPVHGHFGSEQRRTMGTCREIDIAWAEPNTVARIGSRLQFSFDGGITWDYFPGDVPRGRDGAGDIAVLADGSRVLWSSSVGLRYITRQETAWGEWVTAESGPARARVVADLVNPKRAYAFAGATVHQTLDAGETWQVMNDRAPQMRWVRAAINHEGHLWGSAGNNGLHRSTDGGATWSQIAQGMLTVANQVGVGAPAPGETYPAIYIGGTIGSEHGFFRSNDQGATWVKINDAAHHYGNPIVIQADSRVHGRLYVGTNGRGILYGEPRP